MNVLVGLQVDLFQAGGGVLDFGCFSNSHPSPFISFFSFQTGLLPGVHSDKVEAG